MRQKDNGRPRISFHKTGGMFASAASIFFFAFLLNYVWESFHTPYLYSCEFGAIGPYVCKMSAVATIDGGLILGICIIVALISKDIHWLILLRRKDILYFCLIGISLAFFIEIRAVFILEKGGYTAAMPTIFGVGLSPVLQLSVTGLITISITRKVIHYKYCQCKARKVSL